MLKSFLLWASLLCLANGDHFQYGSITFEQVQCESSFVIPSTFTHHGIRIKSMYPVAWLLETPRLSFALAGRDKHYRVHRHDAMEEIIRYFQYIQRQAPNPKLPKSGNLSEPSPWTLDPLPVRHRPAALKLYTS